MQGHVLVAHFGSAPLARSRHGPSGVDDDRIWKPPALSVDVYSVYSFTSFDGGATRYRNVAGIDICTGVALAMFLIAATVAGIVVEYSVHAGPIVNVYIVMVFPTTTGVLNT